MVRDREGRARMAADLRIVTVVTAIAAANEVREVEAQIGEKR